MSLNLGAELVKVALTLVAPISTASLGWFVGARITASWDRTKKRRELTMATTDAFYKSYGEFFAVWKEWAALRGSEIDSQAVDPASHAGLLTRAASAEGAVESLLLKLAVEHRLDATDVEVLGCFRQAYQVLRESIRDSHRVGAGDRVWHSPEAPDYQVFKCLATHVAQIVAREDQHPEPVAAQLAFQQITSNRFESEWYKIGRHFMGESTTHSAQVGNR